MAVMSTSTWTACLHHRQEARARRMQGSYSWGCFHIFVPSPVSLPTVVLQCCTSTGCSPGAETCNCAAECACVHLSVCSDSCTTWFDSASCLCLPVSPFRSILLLHWIFQHDEHAHARYGHDEHGYGHDEHGYSTRLCRAGASIRRGPTGGCLPSRLTVPLAASLGARHRLELAYRPAQHVSVEYSTSGLEALGAPPSA